MPLNSREEKQHSDQSETVTMEKREGPGYFSEDETIADKLTRPKAFGGGSGPRRSPALSGRFDLVGISAPTWEHFSLIPMSVTHTHPPSKNQPVHLRRIATHRPRLHQLLLSLKAAAYFLISHLL